MADNSFLVRGTHPARDGCVDQCCPEERDNHRRHHASTIGHRAHENTDGHRGELELIEGIEELRDERRPRTRISQDVLQPTKQS